MGQVGIQVVEGDVSSIIEDLNRAAAAELHDAYRYRLLAKLAEGLNAVELAEWFDKTAQDEWNHLGMWMDRIISLGGRPFSKPSQAEGYTYTTYQEPPEDPTDLHKMIEDSLKGERAAILFYRDLFKKTQHTDPVTAELAREAMADEIGDEDDLEGFLAGMAHTASHGRSSTHHEGHGSDNG